MNLLTVQVVSYETATAPIQAIRHEVFQIGQGVPPELDFDGLDKDSIHLLAWWSDRPVGTTRLREVSEIRVNSSVETSVNNPATPSRLIKIERVAVLADYQGRGIGRRLMEEAIAYLQQQQQPLTVKVNAQLQVQEFYRKLGFQPRGSVFEEAGIPHIEMRKVIV
ncbi:MAG: GNAT family N-acetyltransferase [Oculatellaceae cyanobacterium Prado106]|jgi:predicted GNAT family N-acyltransferase|nr:GNAT family N-acetyltransferase [Oculatellaceae cyanobacterium Prado106]